MAGRSTYARSVPSLTTNATTTITGPSGSFVVGGDVGALIAGATITAGTTIVAVASSTSATLSAVASGSGTQTLTIGPEKEASAGFTGAVQETGLQQNAWTVAGVNAGNSPDVLADSVTRLAQPTSI